MDLVLGIDIGTGTTKAVLADVAGTVLWSASLSYKYSSPRPGWAEQNPEDWWRALCAATQSLFRDHPEARARVRAVGVSGQGVAVVLIDGQGRVIRPAILWLDQRSAALADELQRTSGDQITASSGKRPASYNVEPKLLWIDRNEPAHWDCTWKFFTTTSFITYRLTGEPVMNHSDGGILLGYELGTRNWSPNSVRLMGLPLSKYPILAESDAVIGYIGERASNDTGIPCGIPVVAGGEDTSSAGLAMGAISADVGQLSLGTANTVYVPVDGTTIHPQLLAFPHVIRGWTLIGGSMSGGGLSTDWIARTLSGVSGGYGTALLDQLATEAATVPCGAGGLIFLPYLAGELQPINDGFACGVFFGISANMSRGHLFRAVLEGSAFAIEHNLSLARSVGASARRLVAVGGPTRSSLLCQTIADVTGLEVHVMNELCGAALGSAILAAKGAGLIDSFADMQRAHSRAAVLYTPSAKQHYEYREIFKTYVELYPRVADLYPRSDNVRDQAISR